MKQVVHLVLILFVFRLQAVTEDTASAVRQRFFDPEKIAEASKAYQQKEVDENSLLQRISRAISEFLIDSMRASAGASDATYWVLSVIVIAIAVFYILRMQKIGLFYKRNPGSSGTEAELLSENIHDMNFDVLISEAEAKGSFNVAIRYLFLQLLKQMDERKEIQWEINKTNRDYFYEVKDPQRRQQFSKASDYFERAWYGDYQVNELLYKRIKPQFNVALASSH
ncbi:MAG: hypothetical protein MUF42_07235 [Cytophagaceae bacterium]|jgi:hypothetical protein|nr:hypothetical protein [Cytophagaceae bacterium]